jgi:hypothetical protein
MERKAMSKEAMKLALEIAIDYMNERLEDHDCKYQRHPATEAERINILADIETVKEALAKQEQGEPVAEYIGNNPDELDLSKRIGLIHRLKFIPLRSKLYTTPQQRTWVGLSVFEINDLVTDTEHSLHDLVERTEAKLKGKNT